MVSLKSANKKGFGSVKKGKVYSSEKTFCMMLPKRGSGSIVRSSIPAFRAEDPGPNPGRSTIKYHAIHFCELSLEICEICGGLT